jgi:hypothetical protein
MHVSAMDSTDRDDITTLLAWGPLTPLKLAR